MSSYLLKDKVCTRMLKLGKTLLLLHLFRVLLAVLMNCDKQYERCTSVNKVISE